MKKRLSKFLLSIILLLPSVITFSQRSYDYEDSERYNWNEFDPDEFIKSAIICAVIIVVGLQLKKNSKNTFMKGFGNILFILGCLGALGFLGGPILGAITIIWQVIIGIAIFVGIIYWVYTEFIDK